MFDLSLTYGIWRELREQLTGYNRGHPCSISTSIEGRVIRDRHCNSRQLDRTPADTRKRYAIGDRTPGLEVAKDGSVTLHVQNAKPEGKKAANWLPAPDGPFWMILRMYGPKQIALDGKYVPPPVEKVD